MAYTTTKGRSHKTRPTYGGWTSFFGGIPSGYGTTSTSKRNGKTSARKSGGTIATGSAYKSCCNTFERKIQSYKTLCAQATGTTGAYNRPSPSTLNTFANWINKGAIVQTCSPQQVAREDPDRLAIKTGLGNKKARQIHQGAQHFLANEAREIEVARAELFGAQPGAEG